MAMHEEKYRVDIELLTVAAQMHFLGRNAYAGATKEPRDDGESHRSNVHRPYLRRSLR